MCCVLALFTIGMKPLRDQAQLEKGIDSCSTTLSFRILRRCFLSNVGVRDFTFFRREKHACRGVDLSLYTSSLYTSFVSDRPRHTKHCGVCACVCVCAVVVAYCIATDMRISFWSHIPPMRLHWSTRGPSRRGLRSTYLVP